MSKRDPRFKLLEWHLAPYGATHIYTAKSFDDVTYYIVNNDDATWHQVLGCAAPGHNSSYAYLSDAKTICQLDHERRLKEWLA